MVRKKHFGGEGVRTETHENEATSQGTWRKIGERADAMGVGVAAAGVVAVAGGAASEAYLDKQAADSHDRAYEMVNEAAIMELQEDKYIPVPSEVSEWEEANSQYLMGVRSSDSTAGDRTARAQRYAWDRKTYEILKDAGRDKSDPRYNEYDESLAEALTDSDEGNPEIRRFNSSIQTEEGVALVKQADEKLDEYRGARALQEKSKGLVEKGALAGAAGLGLVAMSSVVPSIGGRKRASDKSKRK